MDVIMNNDKMREAKIIYKNGSNDLRRILNDLINTIRYLDERGFQGEAKEKFVSCIYADWEFGFKQHIKDIEFLRDLLSKVEIESSKLNDASRSLTGIL
ncbi:hypothetical protein [Clostridium sp. HBUAS56017]|uniref:hypothetical protein n=1 Tax=Clostridium sp. HBUAS56017 TaxID=2571128 RepID=UPI0011776CA2|nr:hypothetical protein [Clostridium sp. HBUAS56017]